jgi:ribokinase
MAPRITVVGSVNLDIVAHGERLPRAGETVTGATLARHPGGKGANQALAARRLGAEVSLVARVGRDAAADEALALLRAAGVDLSRCGVDDEAATGVALIAVAADGENQIVVAPGANARLVPAMLGELPLADALLCQLEVPVATVVQAAAMMASRAHGFVAINLAPALDVPVSLLEQARLRIVNDTEALHYGGSLHRGGGWVAVTHGARGATLLRGGREVASAAPPRIVAADTTGAGDSFVAALLVALLEGRPPEVALAFACAAGAATALSAGAQPSLPTRAQVEALMAKAGG